MTRLGEQLRDDALGIWQAGLTAVDSSRLVQAQLRVAGDVLAVGLLQWKLSEVDRIAVVGAGKAGAGMAAGVEAALGPELLAAKQVSGWINVPADCVRPLETIHLHAARPAGRNEPTAEGVAGAERILEIVGSLGPRDLCLCLISGGGSALLPAPVPGISLADKQAVTRLLSGAGANIAELNTVRRQLSRIKGGRLARASRAGALVSLIISDVLGDPLDVIASGPTVTDFDPRTDTPQAALEVLGRYVASAEVPQAVLDYLRQRQPETASVLSCHVENLVIGNNATAVAAAAEEARRRGYHVEAEANTHLEGTAEEVGLALVERARAMRQAGGRRCLVSGGEPVVRLAPAERRGTGGRNQQLVLAALNQLQAEDGERAAHGMAVLSGGTDGEDGPTDAAGALADESLLAAVRQRQLDAADYLRRNDAYHFFQPLGGLILTGPTHTNVCDVRVVVTGD